MDWDRVHSTGNKGNLTKDWIGPPDEGSQTRDISETLRTVQMETGHRLKVEVGQMEMQAPAKVHGDLGSDLRTRECELPWAWSMKMVWLTLD